MAKLGPRLTLYPTELPLREGYVFVFIVSLMSGPPEKPTFGVLPRIHSVTEPFWGGRQAGWRVIRTYRHQATATLDLGVLALSPSSLSLTLGAPISVSSQL